MREGVQKERETERRGLKKVREEMRNACGEQYYTREKSTRKELKE